MDLVSFLRDLFEITVFLFFYIKNEMGWACGTYGERSAYTVWWENLRERSHLEDPGVDGRMILRWILKKLIWEWTGLVWLTIGTTGGLLLTR